MTNYEKIKNMSEIEMQFFLKNLTRMHAAYCINFAKWLKSEDSGFIYNGEKGTYKRDDEIDSCIIIEEMKFKGEDYCKILISDNVILTVPASSVTRMRSAVSMASSICSWILASKSSDGFLRPAVSIKMKALSMVAVTESRVVPSSRATIAMFLRARRLRRLDLPALV